MPFFAPDSEGSRGSPIMALFLALSLIGNIVLLIMRKNEGFEVNALHDRVAAAETRLNTELGRTYNEMIPAGTEISVRVLSGALIIVNRPGIDMKSKDWLESTQRQYIFLRWTTKRGDFIAVLHPEEQKLYPDLFVKLIERDKDTIVLDKDYVLLPD